MQMSSLATGFLLAALVSPSARPQAAKELSAAQVLERMAKTYAECKSYRDSGVKTTVFIHPDLQWTKRLTFSTAFVRPVQFRYEFVDEGLPSFHAPLRHGYLIWRGIQEVRTWWGVEPGVEVSESLDRAIAAATGVSGGTSQYVPGYLMPKEVRAWLLPGLRGSERVEDADLGAARCYRIKGTLSTKDSDVTLWIDKAYFLLRRIEERNQLDGFHTQSTTDFQPEIDVTILDSELVFDPPEDAEGAR